MYRNVIQLNTVTKERTNEEGLMNHKKKEKRKKEKCGGKKKKRKQWKHQGLHATDVQEGKKKCIHLDGRKESTDSSVSVASLDFDVVLMTEADSPQIETNDTL